MSHSENTTVRIDDCELDSIEVDLIYPDVIRDSKIYYIRQDGTGQRARIPLKYGTTQFGQHWTRNQIIRYAIACRVAHVVGNEYWKDRGKKVLAIYNEW